MVLDEGAGEQWSGLPSDDGEDHQVLRAPVHPSLKGLKGLKAAVGGRKVATTGQRDVRKGRAGQGREEREREEKGKGRGKEKRKERGKEGRGGKGKPL